MNLLEETISILKENNKTLNDILWAGEVEYGYINTDEFVKIAREIEYDSGYGSSEVATDLLVVGKDFWLERHEYDGSEWWEYKQMPIKPTKKLGKIKLVGDNGWESLEEINQNLK